MQNNLSERPDRTTILIADDHQLICEAVSEVLRREQDFDVVSAGSYEQAVEVLKSKAVDVVLLDVKMPGMHGIESVSKVIKAADTAAVTLFSGNIDDYFARLALRAGASGFIPKTISMRILPAAIRLIASGGIYLPPSLPEDVAEPVNDDEPASESVTPRELQIVRLVEAGLSNKEIAREMSTTEVRVKMYLRAIFRKLDARNRAHAVSVLRTRGML